MRNDKLIFLISNSVPNVTQSRSQCQALKIPMCRSLNYTHTILPNFMNHTTKRNWRNWQAKFAIVSTSFTSCRKKKTATYMNSAVCFTTMTMSHIYCSNLEQEHASEIAETVFSSRNFGVKFKENGRITPRIYNKPV